jgi:hypothetical protein
MWMKLEIITLSEINPGKERQVQDLAQYAEYKDLITS